MRLIDADKIEYDRMVCPVGNGVYVDTYTVDKGDIDNMPTVDAIPIAMIQREIDNWDRKKPQSYHAVAYRHLIEDWRRENE